MTDTYRAILSSCPASMLMRLVLTDSAAGERCESRLLVLLFLGSETWWCSGKEVKRVSGGSDDGGSWWWGEPGGVTMSVDVQEGAELVRSDESNVHAASAEERRPRACVGGEYSRHARLVGPDSQQA